MAGGGARGQRDLVAAQRVPGEVPGDDRAGAERAHDQHARAAQAQGHKAHPGGHAHRERRQGAARIGEHQGDDHQPHRRVGERAEKRMPRAPRAQPQAPDGAHRRRQADRVPVAVRFLQARVYVGCVEPVGEHLREQRIAAHRHRREHDRCEQGAPAAGRDPHERDGGGENAAVGEHPPRVLPARVGRHRPYDRQAGERREGEQQTDRPESVGAGAGGHEHHDARHDDTRGEREGQLERGHRREVESAAGEERDEAQRSGERDHRGRRRAHPQWPGRRSRRAIGGLGDDRRERVLSGVGVR